VLAVVQQQHSAEIRVQAGDGFIHRAEFVI
jgi:hypothetical protein